MGFGRISRWLKIWRCVLFHEKKMTQFRMRDEIFFFNMGWYKGCVKCDLWRKMNDKECKD